MTTELARKSCLPCSGGVPVLSQPEIDILLPKLDGWQQYDRIIAKTYHFKNYYQTIAFVNAIAWLSHQEDHHADLIVKHKECHVEYTTHAIHGLSENDFICAAKVEALYSR